MSNPATFTYWLDLFIKGGIAVAVSLSGWAIKTFSDRLAVVEQQDNQKSVRLSIVEENQRFQSNQLTRIDGKLDRLLERQK